MIYITGAGCGDFSLLTLKAKRVIEQADCILYDRLLDPQILQLTNDNCERIYVGKQNHHHSLPQEDIQKLLVEKGQQYQNVVRLKGGDPYVFGRGSEEALYLAKHHIEFEIIPGVTSGIAGSALAGIPVTHRGCALGFRIMSAHTKNDTFAQMDFESMANTQDTLIFLMGLNNLEEIVHHLIQAGKDTHTPIALISNGGRFNQTSVQGTLSNILKQDLSSIVSPGIIVVGNAVKFQNELSFLQHKPLFQKQYLMACMQYDEEILWQFQEAGAHLDMITCGRIVHLPYTTSYPINEYTHILFTSKHGVDAFFHQLFEKGMDLRTFAHTTMCAIGQKTAEHLKQYGCIADVVSDVANSEGFAQCLKHVLTKESNALLPKAKNHNRILEESISQLCSIESIKVYETIPSPYTIQEKDYNGILFTCSFVVHECMKQLHTWKNILQKPVYAMGKKTTTTLQEYGFQHIIELKEADRYQFIESILEEEHHV
ncbi:uroporphyrinogen-III C-methyltransferase [Amedibacillus sp. YH-ame10]